MALQNLYKVTKTLTDLLQQNITKSIDTSLDGLLNVTAIPPEKVENPSNTLSLYLYHVAEDPYYKNIAGPGNDVPDVATTPMALSLFYILTAHHEISSTFDAETQQKLMGYALKTFHDVPVITDQTRVNGTDILDVDLMGRDNSLQVIMRPVLAEDAIAFWSSEDSRTARLSAYYEVRVIILEPEPPKRMPGIVLSLGAFVHELGAPHLDCTRSNLHFQLPAAAGSGPQILESSPARVSTDTGAIPPNNQLELLGVNLTGRAHSLVLKNLLWAQRPNSLGGPVDEIELDPALNAAAGWSVDFRTDRITLDIASSLQFVNAGSTDQVDVVPGLYSVQARVVHEEKVILGQLKQISTRSNEVGFLVIPRIVSLATNAATNELTLQIAPTVELNQGEGVADDRKLLDIHVMVDGQVYERIEPGPVLGDGQFRPDTNSLTLKALFTLTDPGLRPLRLVVNGAASQPFWFEV